MQKLIATSCSKGSFSRASNPWDPDTLFDAVASVLAHASLGQTIEAVQTMQALYDGIPIKKTSDHLLGAAAVTLGAIAVCAGAPFVAATLFVCGASLHLLGAKSTLDAAHSMATGYLLRPNPVTLTTAPMSACMELNKSAVTLILMALKAHLDINPETTVAKTLDILGAVSVSAFLPFLATYATELPKTGPVLHVVLDEESGLEAQVIRTPEGHLIVNVTSQGTEGFMTMKVDCEGNVLEGRLESPAHNSTFTRVDSGAQGAHFTLIRIHDSALTETGTAHKETTSLVASAFGQDPVVISTETTTAFVPRLLGIESSSETQPKEVLSPPLSKSLGEVAAVIHTALKLATSAAAILPMTRRLGMPLGTAMPIAVAATLPMVLGDEAGALDSPKRGAVFVALLQDIRSKSTTFEQRLELGTCNFMPNYISSGLEKIFPTNTYNPIAVIKELDHYFLREQKVGPDDRSLKDFRATMMSFNALRYSDSSETHIAFASALKAFLFEGKTFFDWAEQNSKSYSSLLSPYQLRHMTQGVIDEGLRREVYTYIDPYLYKYYKDELNSADSAALLSFGKKHYSRFATLRLWGALSFGSKISYDKEAKCLARALLEWLVAYPKEILGELYPSYLNRIEHISAVLTHLYPRNIPYATVIPPIGDALYRDTEFTHFIQPLLLKYFPLVSPQDWDAYFRFLSLSGDSSMDHSDARANLGDPSHFAYRLNFALADKLAYTALFGPMLEAMAFVEPHAQMIPIVQRIIDTPPLHFFSGGDTTHGLSIKTLRTLLTKPDQCPLYRALSKKSQLKLMTIMRQEVGCEVKDPVITPVITEAVESLQVVLNHPPDAVINEPMLNEFCHFISQMQNDLDVAIRQVNDLLKKAPEHEGCRHALSVLTQLRNSKPSAYDQECPHSESTSAAFTLGFIMSITVGVLVSAGLVRRKVRRQAEDISRQAVQTIEGMRQKAELDLENVRRDAEAMLARVRAELDEVRIQLKQAQREGTASVTRLETQERTHSQQQRQLTEKLTASRVTVSELRARYRDIPPFIAAHLDYVAFLKHCLTIARGIQALSHEMGIADTVMGVDDESPLIMLIPRDYVTSVLGEEATQEAVQSWALRQSTMATLLSSQSRNSHVQWVSAEALAIWEQRGGTHPTSREPLRNYWRCDAGTVRDQVRPALCMVADLTSRVAQAETTPDYRRAACIHAIRTGLDSTPALSVAEAIGLFADPTLEWSTCHASMAVPVSELFLQLLDAAARVDSTPKKSVRKLYTCLITYAKHVRHVSPPHFSELMDRMLQIELNDIKGKDRSLYHTLALEFAKTAPGARNRLAIEKLLAYYGHIEAEDSTLRGEISDFLSRFPTHSEEGLCFRAARVTLIDVSHFDPRTTHGVMASLRFQVRDIEVAIDRIRLNPLRGRMSDSAGSLHAVADALILKFEAALDRPSISIDFASVIADAGTVLEHVLGLLFYSYYPEETQLPGGYAHDLTLLASALEKKDLTFDTGCLARWRTHRNYAHHSRYPEETRIQEAFSEQLRLANSGNVEAMSDLLKIASMYIGAAVQALGQASRA